MAAANRDAKKRAAKKKGEDGSKPEGNGTASSVAAAAVGVGSLSIQPQQEQQAAAPEDPAKRIRALQKKLRQVKSRLEFRLCYHPYAGSGFPFMTVKDHMVHHLYMLFMHQMYVL